MPRLFDWLVVCATFVVWLAGCAQPGKSRLPEQPSLRRAELLVRLSSNQRDRSAHLELARLEKKSKHLGRALVHFRNARHQRSPADTDAFASLLLGRAERRIEDGDVGASRDTAELAGLEVSAEWTREHSEPLQLATKRSHYQAVLASYRRNDPRSRARAASLLAQALTRFGADRRAAASKPETASQADLAFAGRWLATGGANKRALEVLNQYAARGGDDPRAVAAHQQLRRWWGRDWGRDNDPPTDSVALVASALDDWLSGRTNTWLAIHAKTLAELRVAEVPLAIRPTLLRSRGDRLEAEAALVKALSVDGLSAAELAVLRMESAVLGRPWPQTHGVHGRLAALAQLRAALASDSNHGPTQHWSPCQRATTETTPNLSDLDRAQFCLSVGDIAAAATWDRAAAYSTRRLAMVEGGTDGLATVESSARWLAPLGSPDPVRIATRWRVGERILVELARLYASDPVVAERFARDSLGRQLWPRALSAAVVEFFSRAGDPRRAQRFNSDLLEISPENPALIQTAAILAAQLGDSPRARVLGVKAAARSGDSGATFRNLTDAFATSGRGLDAIWAGKRALMLSAGEFHQQIRRMVAVQMLAIGRREDAIDLVRDDPTRLALLAVEDPNPDRLRIEGFKRLSVAARAAWLHRFPTDAACALALAGTNSLQSEASRTKNAAVLLQGLAWNSGDPSLLAAMAVHPGHAGQRAYLRLAAIAVHSGSNIELEQWSQLAKVRGRQLAQAAARREARLPRTRSHR